MSDDEGGIDLTLFNSLQQIIGPAIDVRLARADR